MNRPEFNRSQKPSHRPARLPRRAWLRRLASGITNSYREVLYLFLQRFVYRGQMAVFGTLCNPVGCAVAYRRVYLKELFDHVEPTLGDDLTNSEDIFIGMAMLNEGYRNIQLTDVCARTVEPEVQQLPKQVYLWSSAFLQSAFYFDALLKSPFKALKRWRLSRRPRNGSDGGPQLETARIRRVCRHERGAAARASLCGNGHHQRPTGRLETTWPPRRTRLRQFMHASDVVLTNRIARSSDASTPGSTAVPPGGP